MNIRGATLVQYIMLGRGLSKNESGPEVTAVEIEFEDWFFSGLFWRGIVGADSTVKEPNSFLIMAGRVFEPIHQVNELSFGPGVLEEFQLFLGGEAVSEDLLGSGLHLIKRI